MEMDAIAETLRKAAYDLEAGGLTEREAMVILLRQFAAFVERPVWGGPLPEPSFGHKEGEGKYGGGAKQR